LSPSEFVFTKDDAPIDEDWLTHAFKKAVIRAKLPASLHWHSLRHSTATLLMQNGATIWQVSQVLGHLDIATTRIYAHEAADQLHSVVNKLDLSTN
jgi:site-specific recombinase XerD